MKIVNNEVLLVRYGATKGNAVICSLIACLAIMVAGTANAQLTDNFTYADGNLTNLNSAWITHSGTANPILVAGGAAVITNRIAGYDVHRLFDVGPASYSSGILTATFDMVVTASAMTGTDFEYFAHFWSTAAPTAFRSRTDIVAPGTAGGDYSIGIATLASTAEFTLGNLVGFTFGQIVPVTISFNISGGTSSLTAGGQTIYTSVVSLGQIIDGFGLRQDVSSSLETIRVDNLLVTHSVPEPATLALGGLGFVALFLARRRS